MDADQHRRLTAKPLTDDDWVVHRLLDALPRLRLFAGDLPTMTDTSLDAIGDEEEFTLDFGESLRENSPLDLLEEKGMNRDEEYCLFVDALAAWALRAAPVVKMSRNFDGYQPTERHIHLELRGADNWRESPFYLSLRVYPHSRADVSLSIVPDGYEADDLEDPKPETLRDERMVVADEVSLDNFRPFDAYETLVDAMPYVTSLVHQYVSADIAMSQSRALAYNDVNLSPHAQEARLGVSESSVRSYLSKGRNAFRAAEKRFIMRAGQHNRILAMHSFDVGDGSGSTCGEKRRYIVEPATPVETQDHRIGTHRISVITVRTDNGMEGFPQVAVGDGRLSTELTDPDEHGGSVSYVPGTAADTVDRDDRAPTNLQFDSLSELVRECYTNRSFGDNDQLRNNWRQLIQKLPTARLQEEDITLPGGE